MVPGDNDAENQGLKCGKQNLKIVTEYGKIIALGVKKINGQRR